MDRLRVAIGQTGDFLATALGPEDSEYQLFEHDAPLKNGEPLLLHPVQLAPADHRTLTELKEWSDLPVGEQMETRATWKLVAAVVLLALVIMSLFMLAWYMFWQTDSLPG